MAAMSFRRVIIPLILSLSSLGLAQDQIPLVCHDQGIQIIATQCDPMFPIEHSIAEGLLGTLGN